MIKTELFDYNDAEVRCNGYLAYDDQTNTKKPVVLIVHDWTGRTHFNDEKAVKLAELGYVGFAIDMYGDHKNGKDNAEKSALMIPLVQDRKKLFQRIRAAVQAIKQHPKVNPEQIAAIGFCFGGLCVLDLARASQDIAGVAAFHANLSAPESIQSAPIAAKILVLHGQDDPLVPPEQVRTFENEMTTSSCDWQLIIYGGAKHAFTNPLANDPDFGTVFHPLANKRSWIALTNFLNELFE